MCSGQPPLDPKAPEVESSTRKVQLEDDLSNPDCIGQRLAAAKPITWQGRGDVFQAPWIPSLRGRWLVIDLWAGISGLCLALLSMGCSFWALAAESDDQAASVASVNFPNLVHIKCVEHITEATLSPFFRKRQVRGVILGGGSPCQGNTVLNNQRLGLQDERSWQPFELCRIKKIIEKMAPDCEIVSLLENVASMPQQVLQKYNEWMGFPPVQVSAGQCGWVQRNRFIWLGTSSGGVTRDMEVPVDWQWQASPGSGIPVLGYAGKKPIPARVFFHQGFQVLFDLLLVLKNKGQGAMHPFTREFFHPTDRTPFSSPEAVGRFYEDNRRYPPAAYEEQSLLWRHSTWRQPEPEERAQLMGWPSQLTSAAPPNSQYPSRATRNSFIGNGFHIPTLLAVLSFIPQLLAGKIPQPLFPVDELQLINRLQGTIWEPDRIYSFPGLLTSSDIIYQMKSCFPGLELPPAIWEHVEQRLGVCDLPSLQCFPAWQRLRGQEWQLLGPIPLDGRARTRIFAGLTGQRYPGTSKKGLDHILPPGLGPDQHILAGALTSSPFAPQQWPEPDVAFVLHAISVWQAAFQGLVNRMRRVFRSVVKALQPLHDALVPHRCHAAQQVATTKNAALVAFLSVILRWPDMTQALCLIKGYSIVGVIPPSGVFRSIPSKDDPDLERWFGTAATQAVDTICASGPPRHHEEILEATQAEQSKNFCGPLRSRTYMDAKFGRGNWRPLQRFLHVQPCGKHRVIDNAKKTLHNSNTAMAETISTVNVDFVANIYSDLLRTLEVSSAKDLQQYPWLDARLATDDLPDAYRGLPVCDDHQNVSIVAIWHPDMGWCFMELYGLAYGLESAVVAFNRFPQLGIAATRRCLYGVVAAYFDDELSLECLRDTDLSQRSLQAMFKALGAAPQEGKSFPPAANRHYLGTSVHVGEIPISGSLRFQPKDVTRHKVLQKISHALSSHLLEADVAGKLRGDLNWMFSQCAGFIGKLAGPLLKQCQQGESSTLSNPDLETLAILYLAVQDAAPRDIQVLPQQRPLVRCYSDASFEGNILRLGWVLFFPNRIPVGGTCVVPSSEIDLWIPRKQQIFPGEALCGLVIPVHLQDCLASCDILWWGDNESAIAALARGTSSQDDVHELVQATHLTLHRLSSRVWWEWIDTSSNPSDGLSRSGLSDPWTLQQNWMLEEIPFPVLASRSNFLASLHQAFHQNSGY